MKKLLALVLFLGLGSSAFAADSKVEAGLGLFDGLPMASDFKDGAKSAMGFEVFGDYNVAENLFVGLEFGHSFGYDYKNGNNGNVDEDYLGIRGKYALPLDGGFRVYGIIGIANYWLDLGNGIDESSLGCSLGLGADYDVNPNVFVGLEGRYHFSPKVDLPFGMGDVKTSHLMIGLHAGYRF